MKDNEGLVVVGFDGLDYELIKEYGLEELMSMKEFGKIDNDTYTSQRMTSECFANFITGKDYREHGVTGLTTFANPNKGKVIDFLTTRKQRTARKILKTILKSREIKYNKEYLKSPSLFEKIPNSKPLFVPSYNPSWMWLTDPANQVLLEGGGVEDAIEVWNLEYKNRKRKFIQQLDRGKHNFLMVQFHKPDTLQHYFAPEGEVLEGSSECMIELYEQMGKLAKYIWYKVEESKRYSDVVFMSDHGLPEGNQHNKNAFYSSTMELFGSKTPYLKSFFDKFLHRFQT